MAKGKKAAAAPPNLRFGHWKNRPGPSKPSFKRTNPQTVINTTEETMMKPEAALIHFRHPGAHYTKKRGKNYVSQNERIPRENWNKIIAHFMEFILSIQGNPKPHRIAPLSATNAILNAMWPNLDSKKHGKKYRDKSLKRHTFKKEALAAGWTKQDCCELVYQVYQELNISSLLDRVIKEVSMTCQDLRIPIRESLELPGCLGYPALLVLDTLDQLMPGWEPILKTTDVGSEKFLYEPIIPCSLDGSPWAWTGGKLRSCTKNDYVYFRTE